MRHVQRRAALHPTNFVSCSLLAAARAQEELTVQQEREQRLQERYRVLYEQVAAAHAAAAN